MTSVERKITAATRTADGRAWTTTLECGHQKDGLNPTMSFRAGDRVRCFECGDEVMVGAPGGGYAYEKRS